MFNSKVNDSAVKMISANEDSEIVISGISGRFPKSDNMSEFAFNLYNKIDMIDDSEDRYKHIYSDNPRRFGKIRNLEKFDASFFSLMPKHANSLDPQARILLEAAYESILDAGVCPKSLVGTNTGVFVGCFNYDSYESRGFDNHTDGSIGGSASFVLSNKLSFCLGLNGPSFTADSACSSSLYALDVAVKLMRSGDCDAALVAGTNLILSPTVMDDLYKSGILALDGIPRPFDEKASGYVRADAVCVIFLQKLKIAKRVYSTVVHSKTNNDGFKKEGTTFPSWQVQKDLFTRVYKDLNMDPSCVDYVEAHATGTFLGDPQEVKSIDEVFSENRKKPLPIGSLKSNIGHAEGAAGVCSIAKALLIFENEKLIPNINITKVRTDCPAFAEGRLRVVQEVETFDGSLIAVNSFGILGSNAHILLKRNDKKKVNQGIPSDDLPRLVLWSGRTEEAVNTIFEEITTRPLDAEFIALLQSTQLDTNPANIYRGFGIFKKNNEDDKKAICIEKKINYINESKRPIVWVYSGVGSQWCGMGKELMTIPIFAEAITNCHKVLEKKDINLNKILTSSEESTFDNILNTFVGVAAIQIGLTNVLNAIGIKPDFIIGHSVGELGCAYADGCLTAEEMILSAYSRGMAINEVNRSVGAMAAIGMGYNELKGIVTNGIEIACHNSSDSCTVSGSVDQIRAFVKDIKTKKVLAKEIHSSGIAFHSSYIASSGPNLLERLKHIVKRKRRSERWISTSVPQDQQDLPQNQYSSPEYHTNNLLNPVLFEEGILALPKNAIVIEIAPHALLQPIILKALGEGVYISLTKRKSENSEHLLLNSIGSLFQHGVDCDVSKLYPENSFPVSRGTPMISSLIKWNPEKHFVPLFDPFTKCDKRNILISLNDPKYEYVEGHTLDGRILFPAAGYLNLVWESFAMMRGMQQERLAVMFEDVKFLRATQLTKEQNAEMTVSIHRGSGRFEIVEGGTSLVVGVIKISETENIANVLETRKMDKYPSLEKKDFYKEAHIRGYQYFGQFKGINSITLKSAEIEWNSNWVAFTDCMLQYTIFHHETRGLNLPTSIRKVVIDPLKHLKMIEKSENNVLHLDYEKHLKVMQCGGITIYGLEGSFVNRRPLTYDPVLEVHKFVPHFPTPLLTEIDAAKFCLQLALENKLSKQFTLIEIDESDNKKPLGEYFYSALGDLPLITADIHYLSKKELDLKGVTVHDESLPSFSNVSMIMKSECVSDHKFLEEAVKYFEISGHILSREKNKKKDILALPENLQVIACVTLQDEFLYVLQYTKPLLPIYKPYVVKISDGFKNLDWIEELQKAVLNGPVIIYSESKVDVSGALGFVNCIRREPNKWQHIRCVFIEHESAPKFDLGHPFYKSQLDLGMAINIFKDNKWGSYKHLALVQKIEMKPRKEHFFADCSNRGDLSSIAWMTGPLNIKNPSKCLVEVHYSPLNFRDVMLATGRITLDAEYESRIDQQHVLGLEYSGVRLDGKRLMGMVMSKAFGTHILEEEILSIHIPDEWTLEEASTVPLVYFTVYAAFFESTTIQSGKKILIHSGSGGIGLAAIRVAFAYGLDVFTTVSTKEKKEFLLKEFPQLKPENIGNSRNTSFEEMIMSRTNGKGVDYVLNSLSEEKLQASIRCLADEGDFLEVGKYDMLNKSNLDMGHFIRGITFRPVIYKFKQMIRDEVKSRRIVGRVARDIKCGIIKPFKANVFDASEIESALRYLASGKHIGKVVIKMRSNEASHVSLPINVISRYYCSPEHSYIILGGLGGFGMELADWLVLRDCKKLVLSSSRGVMNTYQAYRIREFESYGVEVKVSTSDITTRTGCESLIKDAISLGPVEGIFNLAVVLKDALFEDQTVSNFKESLGVKAAATIYFDELSRKMCPELKQFVVFSSVSCGRGNIGQTNYGMANSIMERIVERRVKEGLPGKGIQWGAIGDVGLIANMQERNVEMVIGGTLQQNISSCLNVFDTILASEEAIVSSMVVAEKRLNIKGNKNIIEALMRIMGIKEIKSISMESTLADLGMDSLMGVEIHQLLEREFDCVLTSEEMRTITLSDLQKKVNSVGSSDAETSSNPQSNQYVEYLASMLNNFENSRSENDTILKLNDIKTKDLTKYLIVPGMEGVVGQNWINVAKKIENPTYALQLVKVSHIKDFEECFQAILEDVIKLFKNDANFVIIGYSYGTLLALKIASKLESLGKIGKLILIDGSPKYVKAHTEKFMAYDDGEIHILFIGLVTKKIFGNDSNQILKKVLDRPTQELQYIELEKLYNEAKHNNSRNIYQHGAESLIAFSYRLKVMMIADQLNFQILQKTPLLLIKPTIPIIEIENDYGLQKYAKDIMEIQILDGNHISILENNKLVDHFNAFVAK